jgi:hypothetical protein
VRDATIRTRIKRHRDETILERSSKVGARTSIVSASTFLTITTVFNLQHYNDEVFVPLIMLAMYTLFEGMGEKDTSVAYM